MRIIQRNWKIKLLSLIVAIFLWSFIIANENPTVSTRLSSIPIVLDNTSALDNKGLIVSEGYQKSVDITVSGKRNEIISITPSHVRASVDFENVDEGTHKLKVQYNLPEGVSLQESVDSIDVNIEKIISKDFAIKVQSTGDLQENYVLDSTSVTPEKVTVRGSRTNIEKIANLVTYVDFKNLEKDTTINSEIIAVNQKGDQIDNITYGQQFVNISVGISKQKEVDLELVTNGELNENYRLSSSILNKSKVQVKGPKDKIDQISKIKTQEINIANLKESTRKEATLSLPSDIVLVNQDQDFFVDFEVEEKTEKIVEVPKENFKLKKSSSYNAEFSNNSIKITFFGFANELEKINAKDISLIVDASNKSEGYHAIVPEVKVKDNNLENVKVKNIEPIRIILTR
ncbi:CdaR family protein [Helcococcus kunzii]|uniref:CdaR family protein n=1 Tax=Helcococcus kunzii TaxID=40091 RepID=UPI001BAE5D8E|nr:CdaR family protein [Helcococcus kunzii]MCT1795657.1 CdaR family protein [Helcococcus kunzii]MCT1988777.1 CdaR family protein [Helcococcus kunzii]QUY64896.1 hypothetical protein GUI37_04960 [Helcococcus kunzii]QZO75604.1 hypothetical protein HIF96_04795 [Helcococcus kunzii]